MTDDTVKQAQPHSARQGALRMEAYDPFARGRFPVGVRTIQARDTARDHLFPCEIWYPAADQYAGQDGAPSTQDVFTAPPRDTPRRQMAVRDAAAHPGTSPLILYSHSSGSDRRAATFLATHLSSHGYVVAALNHSELVAGDLAPPEGETAAQKAARADAWIANRVPDIRFLLDQLLHGAAGSAEMDLDPTRIGIVGHSFGGWTALAATAIDRRIRAVVAHAPAGSSQPKPGILPVQLTFAWGRDVPTLYLVAEQDTLTPLAGMYELYARTPATKQMVILRRADHSHFMDNVEEAHEGMRTTPFTGELAWIPQEMRPMAELCSGEQAHVFVRGLTLAHLDAILRQQGAAQQFLAGDLVAELAGRGVDVLVYTPP
ncbi:MAG TPA: hypothetical protein VKY74_09350 [Chloroflexia bacterium]|nr:hypothetical protein [Chloroflexia bacterium]